MRRFTNNLAVANAHTLTGRSSLEAAEAAFTAAEGSTRDRLAAALRAAALHGFVPEPLLDLPEGWEGWGKQALMSHFGDDVCLLWRHSVPQMRQLVQAEADERADSHELLREMQASGRP